ncbi:MAG: amidotransferase [Bacteroidetes bacterium]|nr:MAG: amidotransferase [Bacteroidota bacterium]
MKVGLLECDHVADDLLELSGDYGDMFQALLPDLEFVRYDACRGLLPDHPESCAAYICTGSHFSVYDRTDWILPLRSFIQQVYDSRIPFVGICFGHQLLADALGGLVQPAPGGWAVGTHTFELHERESWMEPYYASVNLMMMCRDQVTALPENALLLASTPDCPTGMFLFGHTMLGIQAHPEFSVAYERALLEKRRHLIGSQKVDIALDTLTHPLHQHVIAHWIMSFFHADRT